jgi:hypothetical protein
VIVGSIAELSCVVKNFPPISLPANVGGAAADVSARSGERDRCLRVFPAVSAARSPFSFGAAGEGDRRLSALVLSFCHGLSHPANSRVRLLLREWPSLLEGQCEAFSGLRLALKPVVMGCSLRGAPSPVWLLLFPLSERGGVPVNGVECPRQWRNVLCV